MGDMAEAFREMSKYKQAKRRERLKVNTGKLVKLNIKFDSRNNGLHLIINHNGKIIDFYPSTGLWWQRHNPKAKNRGIDNLLKCIEANK